MTYSIAMSTEHHQPAIKTHQRRRRGEKKKKKKKDVGRKTGGPKVGLSVLAGGLAMDSDDVSEVTRHL
jgi:hypothetical protein